MTSLLSAEVDNATFRQGPGFSCIHTYQECWGCMFIVMGLVAEWSTQMLARLISPTAARIFGQSLIFLVFGISTTWFIGSVTTYIYQSLPALCLLFLPSHEISVYKLELEIRFDIPVCMANVIKRLFAIFICLLLMGFRGALLLYAHPCLTFWSIHILWVFKAFFVSS